VGPSGQLLDRELSRAGLHRSQVWVDNAVRCWLPGNRAPKAAEVEWCRRSHWGPALRALTGLVVVVPVGVPSAKAWLGKSAGETACGTAFEVPSER
jgi:uracil-DNA glycosylase family 4